MKIIIPAKKSSTRVNNKNWRAFHRDKCLVEIKIEQLLEVVSSNDIFLSCDDPEKQGIADQYEINFLHRNPKFSKDEIPWSEVVTALVDDIPCADDEDIAWVEVVTPLFNGFSAVFKKWEQVKSKHDSLVTVKRVKDFLIDEFGRSLNFNYGRWHCWSQDLRPLFSFESMCIMKKLDIKYFNYVIGKTPYLFEIEGASIDIDDEIDFEMAQWYYERFYG